MSRVQEKQKQKGSTNIDLVYGKLTEHLHGTLNHRKAETKLLAYTVQALWADTLVNGQLYYGHLDKTPFEL